MTELAVGMMVRTKRGHLKHVDRDARFEVSRIVPEHKHSRDGRTITETVECYELEWGGQRGWAKARFRAFPAADLEEAVDRAKKRRSRKGEGGGS